MDGTQLSDHLAAFLVPDLRADDVVGHEVGHRTVEARPQTRVCAAGQSSRCRGLIRPARPPASSAVSTRGAKTFLADDGVLKINMTIRAAPFGVGRQPSLVK